MRRRMVNTGQGRRRLNARAALRQVDFSYCERSGSPASGGTSDDPGVAGESAGAPSASAAQQQQQGEASGSGGGTPRGTADSAHRRRSVSRRVSEGGTGRGRLARSDRAAPLPVHASSLLPVQSGPPQLLCPIGIWSAETQNLRLTSTPPAGAQDIHRCGGAVRHERPQ